MKRKIFTLIAIAMLFTPVVCSSSDKFSIKHFMTEDKFEHTKLLLYLFVLGMFTQGITSDISANFENYVLMNPAPTEPEVMNVMNFFVSLLQKVYVFAIAATAGYILLFSVSPKKRANAKYMIGKLVIGLLLISISPFVIKLFLDFSQGITQEILDQTDVKVAINEYNSVLWKSYYTSVLGIASPVLTQEAKQYVIGPYLKDMRIRGLSQEALNAVREEALFDIVRRPGIMTGNFDEMLDKKVAEILKPPPKWSPEYFLKNIKVAPKADMTFPFLMTELLLVFALYGFLALRYLMVMLWTILFPFTIFFASFELTKGLGKNMIEQTIFWTILQIFFAVSVAVIAVGLTILPAGYDYYKIGPPEPFGIFAISIFSLAACLVLLLTPILLLTLSQRLMAP